MALMKDKKQKTAVLKARGQGQSPPAPVLCPPAVNKKVLSIYCNVDVDVDVQWAHTEA